MHSPTGHEPLRSVTGVRSQRVETVLRYLDELAARAARPPGYVPPRLRVTAADASAFDSIRQRVRVVDDRRTLDRWRSEEFERLRASGLDADRPRYDPLRSEPGENGHEGGDAWSPIEWDERAARSFPRAIVLGDPGFGKSWLLRYEARRLARVAAQTLRAGLVGLDETVLPLLMPLPELNAGSDGPIEEALIEHAAKVLPRGGRIEAVGGLRGRAGTGTRREEFGALLRAKLESGCCTVLLDGWDEVPREGGSPRRPRPHHRERLAERLGAFVRAYPRIRVMLTSRIVGYEDSPVPGAKELELVPFDRRLVDRFVDAWFCDAARANRFKSSLRRTPRVAGLARIPLLLSLLCAIAEEPGRDHETLPSSRGELYELVLRGLVRDWPVDTRAHPRLSEAELEQLLAVLARVAYELFSEGREQFEESAIEAILAPHVDRMEASHPFRGHGLEALGSSKDAARHVVENLKRDGVLVRSSSVGTNLIFLHRTFHEYLAAKGLAASEDPLAAVRAHLPDLRWQEVLRLGGRTLRDDVTRCLDMLLESAGEDVLLRPFHLAAHMAAEAGDGMGADERRGHLVLLTLALWFDRERWLEDDRLSELITAWGDIAVDALLQRLNNEALEARELAADALGLTRSEGAVEALVLRLADVDRGVRWHAARALGMIGSDRSVAALSLALADDDRRVRRHAATALQAIGSRAVAEAIAPRLGDLDGRVRGLAATVMGELRFEAAVDSVVPLLDDPVGSVRANAAEALGRIGTQEAVGALAARLADPDEEWDLRERAASSLGRARSDAGVEALALRLFDEQEEGGVRVSAAAALGEIGSEAAFRALMACIGSADSQVRASVATALGQVGSGAAVAALLARLVDEDVAVRRCVTEALGEIGSDAAAEALMQRLCDRGEDVEVRWRSARALGTMGSEAACEMLALCLAGDEPREVRMSSAEALGQIGSGAAISTLELSLSDRDAGIRGRAVAALGRIGEENTIGAVLATLDDGSAAVRANGAEALGLIGSPTAIPALVSRLRDEDEEAWVRERTAEALGRIGSDVVLDALSQCLVEPRHSLREAAAEALRRIGAVRRIAIPPDRAPARLRASIQAFADACRARQDPASSPGS